MKKILTYHIVLLVVLGSTITSCKKWLDVQPEDRIPEQVVFKNENGFQEGINGFYIELAKPDLYGGVTSQFIYDVLAQRYVSSKNTTTQYFLSRYDWQQTPVKAMVLNIWTKMYAQIAGVNQYLENVEKYKGNIAEGRYIYYRGQALGLRAFLHLELLRAFGPIYSADSTAPSIPIYKALKAENQKPVSSTTVMDFVLQDLDAAIADLSVSDPVTVSGPKNFLNCKMNLATVKALKARAYMYRGDTENAAAAAKDVLNQFDALFPWTTASDINIVGSGDRIFSTEMFFGVYCNVLNDVYDTYYTSNADVGDFLYVGPTLDQIYDNKIQDYRLTYVWRTDGNYSFRILKKYQLQQGIVDRLVRSRNIVPLVRKSEMYYILAECEQDPNVALTYLNAVRDHRGLELDKLSDPASVHDQITKEYVKEFYGEGQLFFYMKRNKITNIPNVTNLNNVSIPLSGFRLPIPEKELEHY
ncbi:SusD-like starch-binding protein associating with outer membrane [Chitinophaga skermanii]|uniref:SusD-like starch-binding protein associating with outer membrane n=1 Tax=Chitinophaga skermanii TaxID=331697 RepID=A0A327Q6G3_9BACT|nr:RagB/SusD family nutrient uptake outer membrane protein [Chitinophaga skermanii]RAI99387.1 SusD-like starch-binding protein associating with outer membrane [Chitinophaga skermanii]